jgi:glycine dehydrogenase subunit 1
MSFVGLTRDEEQRMLKEIGVARFEELLAAIPPGALLERPPEIPGPLSEIEVRRLLGRWSSENHAAQAVSFQGGGIYDHWIPAAVDAVAGRSEFVTAYTPYQPEVAQGTLTAIFEFQSLIAELTGCDVANASMYDGGTAMVEAALLARRQTGRARVVVAGLVHPHYVAVLRTYLDPAQVVVVQDVAGLAAAEDVRAALGPDVACVIYQHPNFFGLLEAPRAIHAAAHDAGALAIAVCDPIALALLEPPGRAGADGSAGADLVVGEAQCLGNPMSFGGPLLGYFAARQGLLRNLPGRLAAETVDRQGRRGYVLTLQTREQHIRRERATSNICTNQALMALRATIYMGLLGCRGMHEVAELCVQKSHHAARLAQQIAGYQLPFASPFFREFVLQCPIEARQVIECGLEFGLRPGINLGRFRPEWKHLLLVAVTELRSADEIEHWAQALRKAGAGR